MRKYGDDSMKSNYHSMWMGYKGICIVHNIIFHAMKEG